MIELIATQVVFGFTVLTPTNSTAAVTSPVIESESVNQVYPVRALQDGLEGTSEYSLTVGLDGSVVRCDITGRSGSDALDAATCGALREARFEPARDGVGNPVIGKYRERMTWRLPEAEGE